MDRIDRRIRNKTNGKEDSGEILNSVKIKIVKVSEKGERVRALAITKAIR